MTPVARLYWLIALFCLPLSLVWLHASLGGTYAPDTLAAHPLQLLLFLLTLGWTAVGGYDLFFSPSNLRRNYPVLANIRYVLEKFRPEIQQYFISNNLEERPFSRE